MTLVTFVAFTRIDSDNVLDAEKVFVALSLFNIIRNPMGQLPNVISNLIPVE